MLHRGCTELHSVNLANQRHLRSIPIHELRLPVIPSKCEESHYQEDIEGVKGS